MADISQPSDVVQFTISRREQPGPLRRRISIRAAAKRATELSGELFSEVAWRRIESGDKDPQDLEIVLMAAAINDLANEVVISPDDLAAHGRPTAAEMFRDWIRERTVADPALAGIDPNLTPESLQQQLQAMLGEIRALPGITATERAQMEKVLLSHLESTLKAYSAQLRILRPK
ncbi:hypothetical protein HNP84_010273 [Thermocatellispora tengchongensis]|uniref:Uncharacterized protein n=1 Tax=Thermocatellispora tengchongensis TaxID=1073253 RepID=A0A840PXC5_9ACTN|nr:hypothetical protein [Thermocatellispora tengchongensis]MBB5140505.1 hypothetical protein [Thermocatellispora tengchongensis]